MINFFEISKRDLNLGKKYSFPIYSFCKDENKRQIILYSNEEISSENPFVLTEHEVTEKEFQIYFKDIKFYLKESDTDYKTFSELNKHRFEYIMLCETRKNTKSSQSLLEMLAGSVVDSTEKNNTFFKNMRLNVLGEILNYKVSESQIINTIICLTEKVFTRNYRSVKVAAISFCLAKQVGITNKQQLANILLISLYKNLGKLSHPIDKDIIESSDLVDKELEVLKKTIQFFEEHDEPIFIHLVDELMKFQNKTDVSYKKIYEIILAAECLCFGLEYDKFSLSEKDEFLDSVDFEFQFAAEIKKGIEALS